MQSKTGYAGQLIAKHFNKGTMTAVFQARKGSLEYYRWPIVYQGENQ